MSKTSEDIIEFTLTAADREGAATARAAVQAFGLSATQAALIIGSNDGRGGRVRCRPDQFGRFIVFRIQEGVQCNRVRELKPRLFRASNPDKPLDVTGNQ